MSERKSRDDERFIEDDANEDAAAAWREVAGGAGESPAAETTEAAPVEAATTDDEAEKTGTTDLEARGARDERGRFSRKGDADKEEAATDKPDDEPKEQVAAADAPPPSWGVKAKAAWQNIPADVRQEIAKREGEVANGLRTLADYKDLKPYADLAKQHGTTVKNALDHYLGIDRLFQSDLSSGLAKAAESYQKDPAKLAQTFLQLAQRYGATVPAQTQAQGGQAGETDDVLLQVLAPVLNPIKSQLDELRQFQSSRVEADRNAQVQSLAAEIQRFSADPKNIYFPNVEADITRLFERGMVPITGNHAVDLQAAYEMAIKLNSDVQEALIEQRLAERQTAERQREQTKVAKARQASRSMGGSKVPGLLYTKEADDRGEPDDLEAEVRRAYRAHAHA